MTYIICYSGGHSSALVAVEASRRYGADRLILLNHDINPLVEDQDIKRFKREVAAFIGLPITYANMDGWESKDQFDVVMQAGAFKVGNGTALCTNRLKTRPFEKYLAAHFPNKDATILYGFDANEQRRIQRRFAHLDSLGYATEFPLTWAERTRSSTCSEKITIRCHKCGAIRDAADRSCPLCAKLTAVVSGPREGEGK